ncbi:class 3 fructose-bisphosphatase [Slackia faecicanis]|uniref:Class 3 fructose-bisphosphatase n=1 Tax=Slackia faecicanis TaxID=255723 RepID=A0A3N0AGN8_9ACTN|nr:fructose-1,6-bisphosphatase [Slackia faecicanis]MDO5358934.1 fructose-1,6-bisphosphatase [Slackia faecicanis]RNL20610.1 class 3 fructose-bisphosphatase [Slackia faecicanis]
MERAEKRYLELLSQSFPSAAKASAEIINLSAVLNLPKGTEFFASDIHGEYEAFSHILRNGSGSIRLKIEDVFGDALTAAEKRSLASLIYYPRERMELVLAHADDAAAQAWYAEVLPRLVSVCKRAAQKYTRSKVRKALPDNFAYIIEELMTEDRDGVDKKAYYAAIIEAIIRTGRGGDLIEELCLLIQRLSIDHLHIVGDIYDRGPYPHVIMDTLMGYHALDIQWGNHDIVWMGASLGQRGCIAHVVRNCARYGNLSILEDAYGINILPLASFAQAAYADDPCVAFGLKGDPDLSDAERELNVKIQKAMAIIQFKVEAQLIDENPSFGLQDRKLLHRIDFEKGTVTVDGIEYELTDTVFPTVDPADPYRLTPEEEEVMQRLEQAFVNCEKLQRHMHFFLEAGSLYKVYNGNLLFHACVPLNADGTLMETDVYGAKFKGRALYDEMERYVRAAFFDADPVMRKRGRDLMWYLWLGQGSPLFAKSKMATFELYLIADKAARKEVKNPFYTFLNDEAVMAGIFEDFGLDPKTSRIVCGHVPVKVKDGEDPVKCDGRVLTIDGGFSKAYQPTTGIAGYTLISNSYELILAAHEPLESTRAAVLKELDIHSSRSVIAWMENRMLVADTDKGKMIKGRIADLEQLLEAYRRGEIAEKE